MEKYQHYGPTLLRITLGIVFIAHSLYLKVFVFTMGGTVDFFESIGLPGFSAYVVMLTEIIGGLLLILGIRVQETAIALAVIAFGAVWVHSGNGWLFTNQGGGWEYPLFLAIVCLVQSLIGSGSLRLNAADRS